jgi:2-dehydro-3-deoxyphosphogalactonate aldolase
MAAELVEEGFTGLKFDPLLQFKEKVYRPWDLPQSELAHAERAVGAIREAVGERADILIGTHGQTTPAAAIRLAARLEKFDPLWLEEPCPPENFKEMGRVARATTIPIATGERLVTPYEFQLLFAEGACAVAQPDLGSAGGITATKKISTLAEANYVLMAPHIWGGPIITAAAIQIDANIPNFLIQESIGKSDEFFDEIIKEPFVWEDGYFVVTDRPGIGIELDEDSLEKYRGKSSDFQQ